MGERERGHHARPAASGAMVCPDGTVLVSNPTALSSQADRVSARRIDMWRAFWNV
jgi:hypothetical protein